jgi:hypothetical protein
MALPVLIYGCKSWVIAASDWQAEINFLLWLKMFLKIPS